MTVRRRFLPETLTARSARYAAPAAGQARLPRRNAEILPARPSPDQP